MKRDIYGIEYIYRERYIQNKIHTLTKTYTKENIYKG